MKYLRLISCIAVFWLSCGMLAAQPSWPALCKPNDSVGIYSITLEFRANTLTGLLILKKTTDSTLRLVMNAEMGPKILDIELSPSGYKTNYAFPKLNRKRILRTFYEDFGALSNIIAWNKSYVTDTSTKVYTYRPSRNKQLDYYSDPLSGVIASGRFGDRKSASAIFYYFYNPSTSEISSMKLEHQHFRMVITLNKISL